MTDRSRFRALTLETPACWLWMGSLNNNGYGWFRVDGKTILAHRASWEFEHSDIPKGRNVLHQCDTPRCVRPDHLFLGTQSDNMLDCSRKGRLYVPSNGSQLLTHCKHGHVFDDTNTYRIGNRRICRRCRADRMMKYKRSAA